MTPPPSPALNALLAASNTAAVLPAVLLWRQGASPDALLLLVSSALSAAFHAAETSHNRIDHGLAGAWRVDPGTEWGLLLADEAAAAALATLCLRRGALTTLSRDARLRWLAAFAAASLASELVTLPAAYAVTHSVWHVAAYLTAGALLLAGAPVRSRAGRQAAAAAGT